MPSSFAIYQNDIFICNIFYCLSFYCLDNISNTRTKMCLDQIAAREAAYSLRWRHNDRDGVSNHQLCLPKRLIRRGSKKTSKLLVTGLWEGNSSVTGEFPAQRSSNAENVAIWWRHHVTLLGKPLYAAHVSIERQRSSFANTVCFLYCLAEVSPTYCG